VIMFCASRGRLMISRSDDRMIDLERARGMGNLPPAVSDQWTVVHAPSRMRAIHPLADCANSAIFLGPVCGSAATSSGS
jgi:hypothetical protein